MPKESNNMRSITIRVDVDLYEEYKFSLKEQGKIPTYDLRNHMKKTVDEFNKNLKEK
ncbi:hypothetical protein [Mammaliicoccus lentus]|uniref:hypothetical protein n=1 Tax=Mammaliicoccus lentus TaxID=42858 RepID=UPI002B25F369|nr:hypothetical protein [Mammaliicoccus lentus]WQK51573.1 hypothetical protein P3U54_14410 [Mammaliicoccus lentus]